MGNNGTEERPQIVVRFMGLGSAEFETTIGNMVSPMQLICAAEALRMQGRLGLAQMHQAQQQQRPGIIVPRFQPGG